MKRVRMRFTSFVRVVLHLHHRLRQGSGLRASNFGGIISVGHAEILVKKSKYGVFAPSRFFDVTAPCRLKSLTADSALFGHGVFEP